MAWRELLLRWPRQIYSPDVLTRAASPSPHLTSTRLCPHLASSHLISTLLLSPILDSSLLHVNSSHPECLSLVLVTSAHFTLVFSTSPLLTLVSPHLISSRLFTSKFPHIYFIISYCFELIPFPLYPESTSALHPASTFPLISPITY